MIHLPKVHEILKDDGSIAEDEEKWNQYVDRSLDQLEWWAMAALNQRAVQDPYETSPAFLKTPSQQNVPQQQSKK